ncbi:MAG: polysaccharide deacetylase family protein [Acidobacteriota bacterium]|nr:polysaccharide deacetylase family protein [Acidobacteriota bacterium]
MKARHVVFFVLMGFMACGRRQPPPETTRAKVPLKPWTCQILNGVLVVQGEVDHPTDLVLEGRSIRETRHAGFGPVRWEMLRPPKGEVAQLRTGEGQVLARWRFGTAPRLAALSPRRPASGRLMQPPAQPEDALEAIRRQLASSDMSAPFPDLSDKPAPADPTLVPVMKADLAALTSRPRVADPARPAVPVPFDRHAWPQPQPLPIPLAAPVTNANPSGVASWSGAGEGFNLVRGPKAFQSGKRRMVLSFDGGSSDESAVEILDTLKARGVRTTIFLTGSFIQKFPDLVRRMEREGHELGNHTMNHPHFAPGMRRDAKWTREKFQEELLAADRALYKVLGHPMDPYWRAPYGEQTRELRAWAEEIGYRHVGWSEGADTLDWATSSEKRIYRNGDAVLERLHKRLAKQDADGLIVLMHLGSGRLEEDRPSKKLGAFMDRAEQEGWAFVKVGDYLRDLRKPAWDPGARLALLEQTSPRNGGSGSRAAMRK